MVVRNETLLAGWTVVVADDEQFSRSIVVRMVRDLGCQEALSAATGQEAMHHLQTGHKHKVMLISDFNMPGIDGLSLAKLVRTGKVMAPHTTPIALLTSHTDSGLVSAAMALDVDSFIVKPVSLVQLAARLTRILSANRPLNPPRHYTKIDVSAIEAEMLRVRAENRSLVKATEKSVRIPLTDAREGLVLAEDICTPSGQRLLAAGVTLRSNTLQKLNDLAPILKLESLAVIATA